MGYVMYLICDAFVDEGGLHELPTCTTQWYRYTMANHDNPPPNPLAAAKEKRQQRSFRLPVSLWQRFDKLAAQTGATVTDLLEQACRYYFAALEKDQRPRK